MITRGLSISGVILLSFGCLASLFLTWTVFDVRRDEIIPHTGGSDQPLLVELSCPEFLSNNEHGQIQATIANRSAEAIQLQVRMNAPSFAIHNLQNSATLLSPGESIRLSWEVTPQTTGKQLISLSTLPTSSQGQESQKSPVASASTKCSIGVFHLFNLNGRQVESIGTFGLMAGALLLTYWLYDRWRGRRELNLEVTEEQSIL